MWFPPVRFPSFSFWQIYKFWDFPDFFFCSAGAPAFRQRPLRVFTQIPSKEPCRPTYSNCFLPLLGSDRFSSAARGPRSFSERHYVRSFPREKESPARAILFPIPWLMSPRGAVLAPPHPALFRLIVPRAAFFFFFCRGVNRKNSSRIAKSGSTFDTTELFRSSDYI